MFLKKSVLKIFKIYQQGSTCGTNFRNLLGEKVSFFKAKFLL